jgi:integrase
MARKAKPAVKRERRKPGTGGIRHKPGRALPFEAEFTHADSTKQYDYFATAEEAAAHLDRLTAARDDKRAPLNTGKGAQSVTDFLTSWLTIKAAHISDKTLQDYTYQCELAIDKIGRERLANVDLLMADTMLAQFAKAGYRNVAQMRMVLKQAFEYALDNDYITKNPFRKSTTPRTRHRAAMALTEAQRDLLLELARAEAGMPLLPLWHLASRLAFRRGEALGLRWSDIDWNANTITITQQRTTVGSRTVVKDAPKGNKTRVVPMALDIRAMLESLRSGQLAAAGGDPDWVVTGLVFVGEHGHPPAAITVNRRLAELIRRANADGLLRLPPNLHPHDLRHTALTILALQGVPANVRKALSGHSTAKMDELYTSHAALEDVRKAVG